MSELGLTNTVGQWVAARPSRSRVFERHGIDYCCGGNKSLESACAAKGIDPRGILAELEADAADAAENAADWNAEPIGALIDHILEAHHARLREELPRLGAMAQKVAKVHGEHHPEMVEVAGVFEQLDGELMQHMFKEERILFPAIRALETGSGERFPGSITGPMGVMEHEHDVAGQLLERMSSLTGTYTPPADACNTFRALLSGLRELEVDLHEHIHEENNVLFPRALALERARA